MHWLAQQQSVCAARPSPDQSPAEDVNNEETQIGLGLRSNCGQVRQDLDPARYNLDELAVHMQLQLLTVRLVEGDALNEHCHRFAISAECAKSRGCEQMASPLSAAACRTLAFRSV